MSLNGGGTFAFIDAGTQRLGFGSQQATFGIDYRFGAAVVAGVLFNYTGTQTRFTRRAGGWRARPIASCPSYSLTPFDNAYLDIPAGYTAATPIAPGAAPRRPRPAPIFPPTRT
ncbi:hypothetical protein [Candidatus Methylocalor cossyra]|uniref:Autotransporter domain-containing protein n=1 Tax=Candidatus Methylocalor cossyra TaxID=3108543 RepID=A0ABM9NEE2_9GAMM